MLLLAAGPLLAIVIAAPAGPDEGCPNARQVTDALQAHVAGALVGPDRGGGGPLRTDALRSVLEVPADGTVVRFSLVDARGDVQLRRTLQAPGRGRPAADCLALAETIATIVERYLSSVPYQARETEPPPPPPPPQPESPRSTPSVPPAPPEPPSGAPTVAAPATGAPPFDPDARAVRPYAGAGRRAPVDRGQSLYEARAGAELDLTRGPRRLATLVHLSAGQKERVNSYGQDRVPTGTASLHRVSAQAGLALGVEAGPGVIDLALHVGADLLFGEMSALSPSGAITSSTSSFRVTPTGELRVGYRVALGSHLFLRPQVGLGSAIVAYDIRRDPADSDYLFHTPKWFSTLGLDVGLVFR